MSELDDKLRTTVARKLRFRRWRWYLIGVIVALQAGALLALFREPVVLVFLPALSILPLVPILVASLFRLPNDECGCNPDFAGQAQNVASCSATHTFFPKSSRKEIKYDVPLEIRLRRRFQGLRSKTEFLVIRDADVFLIVTARSYWFWYAGHLRSGEIRTLGIHLLEWSEEVRYKRPRDEVLGSTWLHATKNGRRDFRYRRNHQIWEVRRYGVELTFGDFEWQIVLYENDIACMFANAFSAIAGRGPAIIYGDKVVDEDNDDDVIDSDDDEGDGETALSEADVAARDWHDVLGTPPDASPDVIKAAYRERLKEYHPDRVAHLGERLRSLASEEALAINQAYAEAMRRWR